MTFLTILTYYVNIYLRGVITIKILESIQYKKDYKKLLKKHMDYEYNRLLKIIELILNEDNMHSLMLNGYSKIYNIEKKTGNLKEYYTAKLNSKIRLVMKPCGNYPYNLIEIKEIEFMKIDDRHYGEG